MSVSVLYVFKDTHTVSMLSCWVWHNFLPQFIIWLRRQLRLLATKAYTHIISDLLLACTSHVQDKFVGVNNVSTSSV